MMLIHDILIARIAKFTWMLDQMKCDFRLEKQLGHGDEQII